MESAPVALYCLSLAAITFLTFSSSLANGFTSWDDGLYVAANPDIMGLTLHHIAKIFTSFYVGNYQPVTMLCYMVEFSLFRLNPLPYHCVNVSLHCLNGVLVFLLIKDLSGKKLIGFLAALLFAIHPLRVESVAWISEQKNLLSSLFYLVSLRQYMAWLDRGGRRNLNVCFFAFLAALLCKPTAITAPLVLVLLDANKKGHIDYRSIPGTWPFFLLAAVFLPVVILAQSRAHAIGAFGSVPLLCRLCIPCFDLLFYLVKTLYPVRLCALYALPGHVDPGTAVSMIGSVLIVIAAIVMLLVRRPFRGIFLFGIAFYFFTLLPVLQIIPVGSAFAADRYSYFPMIGVSVVIAAFSARIDSHTFGTGKRVRTVCAGVFCALLLACGIMSSLRCRVWADSFLLWKDVTAKYPSSLADNNLALEYYTRGDYDSSIAGFSAALERTPDFANAYVGRAVVYGTLGRLDDARRDLTVAIALDPANPKAWFNRGRAYLQQRMFDSAITDLDRTIALEPGYAAAYNNRGIAFAMQGNNTQALADFSAAAALNPADLDAAGNRDRALSVVKGQPGR
jgi:tetratricopeptide (TPR) repeat protein